MSENPVKPKHSFDPKTDNSPAVRLAINNLVQNHLAPLNSKAVMPDGTLMDRGQILQQLGLNPNTPPDAWLAVFGCGVNASALNMAVAQELVKKNVLDARQLDTIRTQ